VGGEHHPLPLDPPGRTLIPIVHGRLSGPYDISGLVWSRENILTPPKFDPRTVQPIASRYTNYASPVLSSVVLVWWFKRYFSYLSRDVFAVLTSVTTYSKLKVKCTLVQALRLCTGRTAHKGSSGIALPFHERGARSEWGVSVTPRLLFTPVKDPVPIVQEAGWAPGPVWTGAENLGPTGIRSPDRPCRSQSLYRLSYPALYNV
jgi:hypothetical protein